MLKTDYNIPIFEDTDEADLNKYSNEMANALKTQINNTNNEIKEIDKKVVDAVNKFGNPLSYKGQVSTIQDLPTSATNGDIYNVTSENKNYIWNGSTWVEYSSTLDLTYLENNTKEVSEELKEVTENKRLKLEGKSEQDGTPIPDNIIPIRNIGDNINEFSSELEIGEIDNTTGLNVSNVKCIRTKDYIKVKSNTTYTIKNSNNYMNVIYFYKKDKTYINYSYSTETSYTFTTGPTAEYIRVRSSSTNKESDLTTKYKLEKGSIATPYTPYGCGSIDYLARNKNLAFLEFSNKVRGYGNGNLTNSDIYDTYKAIVEENTKYTVSFVGNDNNVSNLCYFDKSMNYIKGDPFNSNNPRILTTPENCKYITLAVNHDITNFMIEKGKINTAFIEHQEKNIHISLNKGQVIHKDDYIMNNRVHQNRKTVTLTGNETITRRGYVDSTNKTYRYSIELGGRDTSSRTNLICSHLPVDDQYSQNKSLIFGGGSNEGNIVYFQFVLDEIGVTDVTKISDYLKSQYENGTPVIVEYKLAKEIVTPLAKEQIEALYELQKAKYVDKMELTCLNEIEPTLTDIEKSLEESLLDVEKLLAMLNS